MLEIKAVYDHGEEFADRYLVVIDEATIEPVTGERGFMALGLSENCDSPQGFSQWTTWTPGVHAEEICFALLPQNVQDHALERLMTEEVT